MRASVLALLWIGCAGFARRAEYGAYPSQANRGVILEHAVYTPPDFSPGERLPLVVFLHGGGDSHDAFDRHGISERLDRAIRAGTVPRAVILLPDGDLGFWANWHDESRRYEDWVVEELIPRIAGEYRTLSCPEHCHVMGVSMGGAAALRWAHHRPDTFSTVTSLSGPVLNTEQMISFVNDRLLSILVPTQRIFGPPEPRSRIEEEDLYLQWTSPEATHMRRIVIAWGDSDRGGIVEGSRAFHEHLAAHDVPHEAWEYDGGHGWVHWAPVIERALAHVIH